jgi:PAS domain S-box-containing protein
MDRVNRAMQGTSDLERMMSDVLEAVRAIFACDRAWLVYPCDPDAASWRVPMEHTRPEYPGAFALKLHGAVDTDIANAFRMVRASDGPVRFGAGAGHPLSPQLTTLSVQSQLAMCIDPKIDKPYMFGLHQCSYARVWTPKEEQLFQQIGRRLADALRTLLTFRNLQESEAKLASAQRIAHVGYWHRDVETDRVTWSDETYRIFGVPQEEPLFAATLLQQIVHPDDRQLVLRIFADAQRGIGSDLEYRAIRPDGEVRIVHAQSDVVKDDAGRLIALFGTIQDITERKRAEQLLEDLAGRLISAQEEERRRIGRELHDHICQQLSLLAITIDQLRASGPWPPALADALGNLHQQTSEINDEVHGLSHRLHSTIIDHLGFVPAVDRLISEWSSRSGIRIDFTRRPVSSALSSDVALCLFRVAEESLANIAKHSRASTARVEVADDGGGINLSIEDDGVGFQPETLDTKAGLGFISMRERLRLVGGTIRIHSVPSRGTRVDAWVPAVPARAKLRSASP